MNEAERAAMLKGFASGAVGGVFKGLTYGLLLGVAGGVLVDRLFMGPSREAAIAARQREAFKLGYRAKEEGTSPDAYTFSGKQHGSAIQRAYGRIKA